MDGATIAILSFRTPARILIPKLVKSRDGWKTKANRRKTHLKAARIRIRDLGNSREHWRAKANGDRNQIVELERQLAQAKQDLVAERLESEQLRGELKKK